LPDAIGEMFAISFSGPAIPPEVGKMLVTDRVGTVLLFSDNFTDAAALARLTAQLRALRAESGAPGPLIITVDQEGGSVQRVHDGIQQLPSELDLGAGGAGAVRSEVAKMACGLHQLGVTLDLAPVADLHTNPSDSVIGDRSFGGSAEAVAPLVAAYVRGLHDGGVGSAVKHFPGLGGAAGNPHTALPVDHETQAKWQETQEVSFEAGIAAGTDAVMTTAVAVPALDPAGTPAFFSHAIVTQILRDEMKFNGVIVTDSLSLGAIGGTDPLPVAAVAAAHAGNDLLLLSNTDPNLEESAISAVSSAVESGSISKDQVEASAARVASLAARWGSVPATPNLAVC
jgi:beta-N-acetylhexosaminidase